MQLASDAPRPGLSDTQQKALHALRSSFTKDDGATGTEWKAALPDVPERTFYRAKKVLIEGGYISTQGQRFVWTGKAPESESLPVNCHASATALPPTATGTATQENQCL